MGDNWLKLLSKRILKRVLQQSCFFSFSNNTGQSAGWRRKHQFWGDKEKKQVEHKERDNCAVTGQTPSVFCFLSLLCWVVQYHSGNSFFDNMFGYVCHMSDVTVFVGSNMESKANFLDDCISLSCLLWRKRCCSSSAPSNTTDRCYTLCAAVIGFWLGILLLFQFLFLCSCVKFKYTSAGEKETWGYDDN